MPNTAVVHGLMARIMARNGFPFRTLSRRFANIKQQHRLKYILRQGLFCKSCRICKNVILESGASPLTEKQWFGGDNYNDGFNDISSPSWIWGGILTSEQAGVAGQWICFTGNICPEQFFGVCNSYAAFKAISKKLFEKIPDEDWRKTTWIAPEDAGKAPGKKYRTILTDEELQKNTRIYRY